MSARVVGYGEVKKWVELTKLFMKC
jgi:hypothetical protein